MICNRLLLWDNKVFQSMSRYRYVIDCCCGLTVCIFILVRVREACQCKGNVGCGRRLLLVSAKSPRRRAPCRGGPGSRASVCSPAILKTNSSCLTVQRSRLDNTITLILYIHFNIIDMSTSTLTIPLQYITEYILPQTTRFNILDITITSSTLSICRYGH